MTVALGIPHTPWKPERVATYDRLREQLGGTFGSKCEWWRTFEDREPNWSWSHRLWTWGLETGADHLLQLQDDVIVDGHFWPHLLTMLVAVPDQIIGLESVHPASEMLYRGGNNWYTTSDGLIGVGYVLPRAVTRELLAWRTSSLRPGACEQVSEDTLIDMFCIATGRKVWHPVPTIIDHDVSVASTYGNDMHTHRRPVVTTVRGATARDWDHVSEVPHLGRFYELTARMCRRFVKGFHAEDMIRALADRGGA